MASRRSRGQGQRGEDGAQYHADTPAAPSPYTPSASALSSSRMTPAYLSRYRETPAEKTRKRKRESWADSISSFFADTLPGFSSVFKGGGTGGPNNTQKSARKQRRKTVGYTDRDNEGSLAQTPRALFANDTNEAENQETPRSVKFSKPLIHSQVFVPKYIGLGSDSGSQQSDVETELSFDEPARDDNDDDKGPLSSADFEESEESARDDNEDDDKGPLSSADFEVNEKPEEEEESSTGLTEDTEGAMASSERLQAEEQRGLVENSGNQESNQSSALNADAGSGGRNAELGGNERNETSYERQRPSEADDSSTTSHSGGVSRAALDKKPRNDRRKTNQSPNRTATRSTNALNGSVTASQALEGDRNDGDNTRAQQTVDSAESTHRTKPSLSPTSARKHGNISSRSAASHQGKDNLSSDNTHNVGDARENQSSNRAEETRPRARRPTFMKKSPIVVVRSLLSKGHRPLSSAQEQDRYAQIGIPRKFTRTPKTWSSEPIQGSSFCSVIPERNTSSSIGDSLGGWLQTSRQETQSRRSKMGASARSKKTYTDFDDGEVSFTIPNKLSRGEKPSQGSASRFDSKENAQPSKNVRPNGAGLQGSSSVIRDRTPHRNVNKGTIASNDQKDLRSANTNVGRSRRTSQSTYRNHPVLRHSSQNVKPHQRRRRRSRLLWRGSSVAQDNDTRSVGSSASGRSSVSTVPDTDNFGEPDRPASVDPERLASQVMSRLEDAVKNIDEVRTTSVVRKAQGSIVRRSHPPFTSAVKRDQRDGQLDQSSTNAMANQDDSESLDEGEFQFTEPRVFDMHQLQSGANQQAAAEDRDTYAFTMPQDERYPLEGNIEEEYTFTEPQVSSSPTPNSRLTIDDLDGRAPYDFVAPHD